MPSRTNNYPHDPNQTSVGDRFQGPSAEHYLGTDRLGRDNLARILYGEEFLFFLEYLPSLLGLLLVSLSAFSQASFAPLMKSLCESLMF